MSGLNIGQRRRYAGLAAAGIKALQLCWVVQLLSWRVSTAATFPPFHWSMHPCLFPLALRSSNSRLLASASSVAGNARRGCCQRPKGISWCSGVASSCDAVLGCSSTSFGNGYEIWAAGRMWIASRSTSENTKRSLMTPLFPFTASCVLCKRHHILPAF